MKYPYDIVSYVRNKTFSIEAHFVRQTKENPLKVFDDTFSRYVVAVIVDGKAATCNLPIENLAEIRANTDYAHNIHMNSKYSAKQNPAGTSPAFTVRFFSGTLKGKTPVDVLLERGEDGRKILNDQYKWLKDNLEKYPKNKTVMDAIVDASKVDLSTLKAGDIQATVPIELFKIDCRPLVRKKRDDGKCFCYEVKAEWDSSKNYPVSVRVSNYYAPVEKKEDGLFNVILSQKDRSTEVVNEFNMTAGEWLHAVKKMETVADGFERMYLADSFKLAEQAAKANREEGRRSA